MRGGICLNYFMIMINYRMLRSRDSSLRSREGSRDNQGSYSGRSSRDDLGRQRQRDVITEDASSILQVQWEF